MDLSLRAKGLSITGQKMRILYIFYHISDYIE